MCGQSVEFICAFQVRHMSGASHDVEVGTRNSHGNLKPDVEWKKHIWHLPYASLLSSLGEPPATFESMIARAAG